MEDLTKSVDAVFDQDKPASVMRDTSGKYLEQDGHIFSHTRYDRFKKTWDPTPQLMVDFHDKQAADKVTKLLEFVADNLKKIVDVLPALDMYSREAIARAQVKDKSFNRLKGELGAMKRELSKYDKLKKLASVKDELAKLEDEVTKDGKQD